MTDNDLLARLPEQYEWSTPAEDTHSASSKPRRRPSVTDQTPKQRVAAALLATVNERERRRSRGTLSAATEARLLQDADPTLICPDPEAHARLTRAVSLLRRAYESEHHLARGFAHVKDFDDCGSYDCPGKRERLAALEDKP